jgi:hypothetical protein
LWKGGLGRQWNKAKDGDLLFGISSGCGTGTVATIGTMIFVELGREETNEVSNTQSVNIGIE